MIYETFARTPNLYYLKKINFIELYCSFGQKISIHFLGNSEFYLRIITQSITINYIFEKYISFSLSRY